MSTHIFPFLLIKFIESSVTPLPLCKWRQPTIIERGTRRPGPILSVSHSLEHSQAFAGLQRWPRHYSTHFWTSERGEKYKVWKNNTIFHICQRPGLSLCKPGSIRTSLFATYWLHIEVLIKIKFPTLVSVAYLQWNSVVGSCQKIHSPPPNICTFLNSSCKRLSSLSVLVPEEQKVLKRHEKAASSGKEWLVWRYFTSDLAESWERQKNAV